MSIRPLLSSLLAFALSLAICLAIAEVAIRVVRPQARLTIEPGGLYTPDPPGRYRLNPGYRGRIFNRVEYSNEIRINGKGLRGAELLSRSDDRLRVLAIGDSFIFGVGVEDSETLVAVLASKIAERGREAEALNGGIPAFGIPDAVGWFERHGRALEPDVVILGIFLGNDLVDASPDREAIVVVDGLLKPQHSPKGLGAWLYRHSQLYVALKTLSEQPGFLPLRKKLGMGEPWRVRILREEFGIYKITAPVDLAPAIEATDAALADLVSIANRDGFLLQALLIPSEIQIDPIRWQAGLANLGLDSSAYDPEVPTRIFNQLLSEHEIPALDLSNALAPRLKAGEKLYFEFDRHWTPEGHSIAAEELDRELVSRMGNDDTGTP